MTNFEKVGIFMKTFGQELKTKSELSTEKINKLRISLIEEELDELKLAIKENNIKEVADALTDILYVTYGAGHAFGINLDKSNLKFLSLNLIIAKGNLLFIKTLPNSIFSW